MKTKHAFAQEAKVRYGAKVQGTDTTVLAKWSSEMYETLKGLEDEVEAIREKAKKAEEERSKSRIAYREDSSTQTLAQWHESVAVLNSHKEELKKKRSEKNEAQALAELLATELGRRREYDGPNVLTEKQVGSGRKRRRLKSPQGNEKLSNELESCPFCSHGYTVRDGTCSKLNSMGEPMQLWKCQCREMAPPCRNCPKCKENPEIMAVDVGDQLLLCREKEACDICSCECPGGGKWIQGDEKSREKYRKKALERHQKLSGVLKTGEDGDQNQDIPKRLPADLRNQLEAAHTLLKVFTEEDTEADCQSKNCIACKNHH